MYPPNFKKIEEVWFNTLDELIWNYPQRQMIRRGGGERKESCRLNLMIFLICAFLVALSIYAGVLTKQTVKLFSKTVLYSLIGNSKDNKTIKLFIFKNHRTN